MNILDIVLIIPLLYGTWIAFHKGFIMALFTILAFIIGLYAAFHFADQFSLFISSQSNSSMPKYLPAFSFLVLFLVVGICIYFGGKTLEKALKLSQLSLMNKLLGSAFGLLKWAYIVGGSLVFINAVDSKEQVLTNKLKTESILYPLLDGLIRNSIPDVTNTELYKRIKS